MTNQGSWSDVQGGRLLAVCLCVSDWLCGFFLRGLGLLGPHMYEGLRITSRDASRKFFGGLFTD